MEAKCEYYLESGREYMSHYATVVRDGMPLEVLKEQLVVGDLISFRPGDEICADIKLVEGSNVHVNVDMLADREKHFYEQIYDSIDRLFSKGDIIFRASFIFSGMDTWEGYTGGKNVQVCIYRTRKRHCDAH